KQNAAFPLADALRWRAGCGRSGVGNTWEIHGKSCPLPRGTLNRDGSTMTEHNTMDDRQAHPCPFSDTLGGKKRLEDVLDDIGCHPRPRITEGQTHVGAWWYGAVMGGTIVRHLHRLDTDLQEASRLPHRILGIRAEVHEHLVQLVAMRQHH